ncbi:MULTISPECIES: hypothetical protein [Saccharothrix]|uniref:hypothetical protein n=1 Tax=Saccharothrix TaxID=2071 RepID=UPI00093AE45B|nr:hypothetical protein [Saccharothrix sp. CB00851]OKI36205.1 hypothetical protein A6A25_22730 [Saccharothrix sp. CB00851]
MTADALDGIDDVDWASLGHAYGSAEDVPGVLRDAVGADEELARDAIEHLYGSVYHQGTLYSATPWAVPFVARLAADPGTPRRAHLVNLLGAIAKSEDARPEVLADVRTALARETSRLLPLLDDPDDDVRHLATHLLGHLPRSTAAEVVPALRARQERETSPLVLAGLLAAAVRLSPADSAEWPAGELAPNRPAAASAGALWAIADAGLPWPDAATDAVIRLWLDGEPLKGWIWSHDPFSHIVARLDRASFTRICRALFERGGADAARTAIRTAYQRCVRSRSAREEFAPLLAAGIDHPDVQVRVAAATAVRDVTAAAALAADSLAALVADPRAADDGSPEARLVELAFETLIGLGDPRWHAPLATALTAGRVTSDGLHLLIDIGVPCDPALLAAVRDRLAALPAQWSSERGGYDGLQSRMQWHNEVNALTRLPHHWGPDAADAVPELVRFVPHDEWWAVRAIGAIGPAASAAVPALAQVQDDPTAKWERRLDYAQALSAVTGDVSRLSGLVAEAVAAGETVAAARVALNRGLPLDGIIPALRDIAGTPTSDEHAIMDRIEAAKLLLDADAAGPQDAAVLSAAADALDAGKFAAEVADLTGRLGPAAADLVPGLRAALLPDDRLASHPAALPLRMLTGNHRTFHPVALALRRLTGDTEPLVEAVRLKFPYWGVGPWLVESLRELGADAAPLLPMLRELAHGDDAISLFSGVEGQQVRRDEEQRGQLLAVLAELGH